MGRVKSITACGLGQQRQGIGGELDAIGLQARPAARIHAQIGMAFGFQRARTGSCLAPARSRGSGRGPCGPDAPATTMFRSRHALSDFRIDVAGWRRRSPRCATVTMAGRSSRSPIMIAGLHHIHDRAGGLAVAGHFGDGLMQIGIELAVARCRSA